MCPTIPAARPRSPPAVHDGRPGHLGPGAGLPAQHPGADRLAAEEHRPRVLLDRRARTTELHVGTGLTPGRPDADQLNLGIRIEVAVALLVQGLERRAEIVGAAHGQLVGLSAVAQVEGEVALRHRYVPLAEHAQHADHAVLPALRGRQPEGGEHAAGARDEHHCDPQLVGHLAGVQPSRASEGQQRERPRVDALLDGHDPQRAEHLDVGHADDARRARLGAEVQPHRELLDGAARGLRVEPDPAGHGTGHATEDHVRVGHRRLGPAAGVTGGSGLRPCAAGPDPQRPARVSPGDRPAAGADGVDVDHRQRERPAADLVSRGLAHHAALHDADVA